MQEIFIDILDYEGLYQVSNYGNVKSLNFRRSGKEKILKLGLDTVGYLHVSLSNNGIVKTKLVHQLVAIAFLKHKPDGMKIVVDHIDNNKLNNSLNNLQLISNRENSSKDRKGYSSKYVGVSWAKRSKKWVAEIRIKGKKIYLGLFTDELEASRAYQKKLNTIKKQL